MFYPCKRIGKMNLIGDEDLSHHHCLWGFPKCWDLHSLTFALTAPILDLTTKWWFFNWVNPKNTSKSIQVQQVGIGVNSDQWLMKFSLRFSCSQWPVNIGECWGEIMKNPNGFLERGRSDHVPLPVAYHISSGKRLHNYGNSRLLIGKSTTNTSSTAQGGGGSFKNRNL